MRMSTTGVMQRCWTHDYCAPSFYMITVLTEPRRGCLSALAGTAADPLLQLSPIGAVVREVWQRTAAVYPGVEACECVVMPDHFHGILWVKERLERPMGHIVKAFKRVSTQECRSRGLLLPPDPSLVPAAGQVPPPPVVPPSGRKAFKTAFCCARAS
jgi:REP element-mobilizing transposase RayT